MTAEKASQTQSAEFLYKARTGGNDTSVVVSGTKNKHRNFFLLETIFNFENNFALSVIQEICTMQNIEDGNSK